MKKITLLFIAMTISLIGMSQVIHNFDAASNGIPTTEFAINKGIKEPVFISSTGKKFIKTVTKEGKPSRKYIPVPGTITVKATSNKNIALKYKY